ncbi:MAG: hypothetical protein WKF71_16170 [Pyrinomonadaceae bacterium]
MARRPKRELKQRWLGSLSAQDDLKQKKSSKPSRLIDVRSSFAALFNSLTGDGER